jgi:hypothetical protein
MYRFFGGRILLAISALAWLRNLIAGRRERAAAQRAGQAAAVKPAPRVVANER